MCQAQQNRLWARSSHPLGAAVARHTRTSFDQRFAMARMLSSWKWHVAKAAALRRAPMQLRCSCRRTH